MDIAQEDLVKFLLSFATGTIIGMEREYRSKSAGLRTMILISLGSTLFTVISVKLGGDVSRIAANIVTGIGFIGGGIIFQEDDKIVGLTTASTVWVTAALGMCIGAGLLDLTFISFILLAFSLVAMVPLERFINLRKQRRSYRIMSSYQQKTLKRYDELFRQYGMSVKRGKQSRTGDMISGNWVLQGSEKQHEKLIKYLLNDPGIIELDF